MGTIYEFVMRRCHYIYNGKWDNVNNHAFIAYGLNVNVNGFLSPQTFVGFLHKVTGSN